MKQVARDIWEIIREPLKGVAIGAFLFWMVLVAFVHAQEGVTWQWSPEVVHGVGRRARIPVTPQWIKALDAQRVSTEPKKGEPEWVAAIVKQKPFEADPHSISASTSVETEVRLPNGRRVDIIWRDYAIEADWAEGLKPFEAIGQALHYADWTGKKPAVLLLVRKPSEAAISDCKLTCALHGIALWIYDTRDGTWMVKPDVRD